MFPICSTWGWSESLRRGPVRHDTQLRAAARVIYEACYPSEEWAPVGFEEAERCGTVHYRQAVDGARRARCELAGTAEQLPLFGRA